MPANENRWMIPLRCLTGELVVWQPPNWPPSTRYLLNVNDDYLPPLPAELNARLKQDQAMSFSARLFDFEVPKTRTEPRRRFVRARDLPMHSPKPDACYTGLIVWAETTPLWVDVPA